MTTPQTSGVMIFPPLIQVAAIAIGFLIEWAVPVQTRGEWLRSRPYRRLVLLTIALALIASAARIMFGAGTTPNPTRPSTVIVTNGPFRFTRNPMYLAFGS